MISVFIHVGCNKTDLFYPHMVQVFRISLTFWLNHISVWQTLIVPDSIICSNQRLLNAVIVRRCIGAWHIWLSYGIVSTLSRPRIPTDCALIARSGGSGVKLILELWRASGFRSLQFQHFLRHPTQAQRVCHNTSRAAQRRGETHRLWTTVYFPPLWALNITLGKFKHIYTYWIASLRCPVLINRLSCFTVHYDTVWNTAVNCYFPGAKCVD